ncbi:hypothetical protein EV360DRAFT_66059 [Lentinula raphanica]|nr:hypothetical protein EV360DRAFT_66059 [Lentinula raphanica]
MEGTSSNQGSEVEALGSTEYTGARRLSEIESETDYSAFYAALPSEYLFFKDTSLEQEDYSGNWGIYSRSIDDVLGVTPEVPVEPEDSYNEFRVPRCFNCGSPEHLVASCLEPRDRDLVSLARQMRELYYEVYRRDRIGGDFTGRIYSVEEWRSKRLAWIDQVNPGEIKGPDLREALGIYEDKDDGQAQEWLRKMAVWGYPPGWVNSRDPKELMREHVQNDHMDDLEAIRHPFYLYHGEDDGDDEAVVGPSHSDSDVSTESVHGTSRRWASYPPLRFPSSLLPVYTNRPLPPAGVKMQSFEYNPLPSAGSEINPFEYDPLSPLLSYPPPPSVRPPPLPPIQPPSPPTEPPPPLPPSSPHFQPTTHSATFSTQMLELSAIEYESDMDISDDDD